MIVKGLFTQIVMLMVSVGIVFTYIQPRFAEVSEVQDNISVYQEKRSEVVTVNSQLATLVSRLENVSSVDQRRLFNYLPNEVDTISVVRDLYLITTQAGVIYKDANFSGLSKVEVDNSSSFGAPTPYSFNLSVEGTYSQVKELFALIESNDYPLEVHDLQISRMDGGFLSVNVNLVTYAYDGSAANIGNQI